MSWQMPFAKNVASDSGEGKGMEEFFEKMKQSIGRGMVTVGAKSKAMIETTKIKGQIGTIQEKKRDSLEELGNIVYAMFRKGSLNEKEIMEKCREIADLDKQIEKKEQELKKIYIETQEILGQPKRVGRCECGAEVYDEAKFCGACGRKIQKNL